MSPTTWTEVTTPAQGWQAASASVMEDSSSDYFIDVLFEGTAFSSAAVSYTEITAPAAAYVERTAPTAPWTEVTF